MSTGSRVLIELLLGAIFLMLFVPRIPSICDEIMGYDDSAKYRMESEVKLNKHLIEVDARAKIIQAEIDELDRKAGRKPSHR